MARMFPAALESSEVRSRVEPILYELFRNGLSSEFTVVYGARWYLPCAAMGSTGSGGEADFIILHPRLGILVVEAKAGSLRYSVETGKWTVDGGTGAPKRNRHSPLEQAEANRHALEVALRRAFPEMPRLKLAFAVAMPECSYDASLECVGLPKSLFLDCQACSSIETWVRGAFSHFGSEGESISSYVLDLFVDLIASRINFSDDLTSHFALTQQTIETLTKDQYKIICFLRNHRRAAISGCAGSGKTLVAAEKAVRLDRAGLSTLMLCHNPFLADYLRTLTRSTNVRVEHFAHWIARLLREPSQPAVEWTHYLEPSNQDLERAFDSLVASTERYDAVIVDEGQDFREEWWILVQAALFNEQSGIMYIFYDDNQALLPFRSKYPLEQAPFSLSRNCRNAGEVFELVRRFHPQAPETALELQGRGLVRQVACVLGDEVSALTTAVQLATDILTTSELVVLTTEAGPVDRSLLFNQKIELCPNWKWQDVLSPILQQMANYFGQHGDDTSPHPRIPAPNLSEATYPTIDDIQVVCSFARRLSKNMLKAARVRPTRPLGPTVKWRVDHGDLHLYSPPGLHYLVPFFESEKWVEGIPRPRVINLGYTPEGSTDNSIKLSTVESYKGLEAPGVILFVAPRRDELETDVYVGISRARLFLCLVGEANWLARLSNRHD